MASLLALVAGLGNPGTRYDLTVITPGSGLSTNWPDSWRNVPFRIPLLRRFSDHQYRWAKTRFAETDDLYESQWAVCGRGRALLQVSR